MICFEDNRSLVYHHTNPTFGFGSIISPETEICFPDDFEAAAEVDSANIDTIFELTNLWPDDPRLRILKEKCRSTSVGDLIETPDHHIHLCLPLGWKDLGIFNGDTLTIPNDLYKGLQK